MFDEAIKWIMENLEIEINQETDFGPYEKIIVKLKMKGHVISEDYCFLPDNDG